MTCPNRDGTLGTRGCIFCSEGGSGDFSANVALPITEQIEEAKKLISHKVHHEDTPTEPQYIAYFQAFTNTYGSIPHLRKVFYEAIHHPDIAVLSIATRPDCLDDEVIALLDELNHIKPVWIELGLQTIHESTARLIRRGYPLSCYDEAVKRLHHIHIDVIVHLIIGLPGETREDILTTVRYVSSSGIQGVKLQLLHVLKNTDLASIINQIHILNLDEYVALIVTCIEHLDQNIVIHRLTGDGPKDLLLEPKWSTSKKLVLNSIQHAMKVNDSWQGKMNGGTLICNQKL
jgi:radical SAM protein (TIGR01212 family)